MMYEKNRRQNMQAFVKMSIISARTQYLRATGMLKLASAKILKMGDSSIFKNY
jgi:hypothetical protein